MFPGVSFVLINIIHKLTFGVTDTADVRDVLSCYILLC